MGILYNISMGSHLDPLSRTIKIMIIPYRILEAMSIIVPINIDIPLFIFLLQYG